MKKYLIPLVLILLAFPLLYIGCRDHIERDIKALGYPLDTITPIPLHCSNGIKDSGEVDIDCGGTCPACVQMVPSCTIGTDSCIFLSSNYGGSDKVSNITAGYNSVNGLYEFKGFGTPTSADVYIAVKGNNPLVTHAYNIANAIPTGANDAKVYVRYYALSNRYLYLSSGTVYITKTAGGKYIATVCNGYDMEYIGINYEYFNFTINITAP